MVPPTVKVTLVSRQGKELGQLELPPEANIDAFKDAFHQQFHYYPERQWFNINSAKGAVFKEGTLAENNISDGTSVVFKDLGVQISWRLVFAIEYAGPLILFPLFYYFPNVFYSNVPLHLERPLAQRVGFWLAIIHYAKRELESLFVHRFSSATMPIYRLPINCFHYWIIFGASVGYFVCHPRYHALFTSPIPIYTAALVMLVFEFFNFQTHITLRNLRPRGTKSRGIPQGWGFELVSCANYFWESLAWLVFSILTFTLSSWIFLVVAFVQMSIWALKRHHAYQKEFKDYPRKRRAIVPFVL
uniref:3-oxo-5-alpha-steroid 4-dehydrogenase C-terminal domain-containing protein n=1 Tax=Lankesteria abbotti TaxID=340204 RepID=A0A6T5U6C0_9APIC|mmetsp:Transcript_1389/g.1582  ORF Transcript_1389/g.1582 Transcript_1389/m.1582 type:complete len:302 (+) Transcript_1389:260-1165(+)